MELIVPWSRVKKRTKEPKENFQKSQKFPGISENVSIYCMKSNIHILLKASHTVSMNYNIKNYDPMEKGRCAKETLYP